MFKVGDFVIVLKPPAWSYRTHLVGKPAQIKTITTSEPALQLEDGYWYNSTAVVPAVTEIFKAIKRYEEKTNQAGG